MKLSAIARRTEGISFLGAGSATGLADPEVPLPHLRRPRRGPGDLAAGACNEQRPDPTEIAPRESSGTPGTIAAVLAFALSHLVFVPLSGAILA